MEMKLKDDQQPKSGETSRTRNNSSGSSRGTPVYSPFHDLNVNTPAISDRSPSSPQPQNALNVIDPSREPSRELSMEPQVASVGRQDTLAMPSWRIGRSDPEEQTLPSERATRVYRAGRKWRSNRSDVESSLYSKEADSQVAIPETTRHDVLRLLPIPRPTFPDWVRREGDMSVKVECRLVHPDCLLLIDNCGATSTIVIDVGLFNEHINYIGLPETVSVSGVNQLCRLDQFYARICQILGRIENWEGLCDEHSRRNYRLAMTAINPVLVEVVNESNWATLIQEKARKADWRFVLYFIEVYPDQESGTWESIP